MRVTSPSVNTRQLEFTVTAWRRTNFQARVSRAILGSLHQTAPQRCFAAALPIDAVPALNPARLITSFADGKLLSPHVARQGVSLLSCSTIILHTG